MLKFLVLSILLGFCKGVSIDIPRTINESDSLTVVCVSDGSDTSLISLRRNDQGVSVAPTSVGSRATFSVGTVTFMNNGDIYQCTDGVDGSSADASPLNVQYAPRLTITDPPNDVAIGSTYNNSFTINSNPAVIVSDIMILRNGNPLPTEKHSITTNSAMIFNIACNDNGTYILQSSNLLGTGSESFIVSVQPVKPSFMNVPAIILVSLDGNDVDLASYISGCPENIEITCRVNGRDPLVSDVANNRTPVVWQRSFFTGGLIEGSSEVTCMARSSAGLSVGSASFTVVYADHPSLPVAIAVPIVIIVVLLVLVIVIIVVVVVVKKKK